jgi:MobA/MobL family
MVIFHFSAKIIGRSGGRSAVAAAAYRAGEKLHDERIDRDHDFTDKAGVEHSEVLPPEGAPEHLADREQLWNEVERNEKRKDAQLVREVEFALPRELEHDRGGIVFRQKGRRGRNNQRHSQAGGEPGCAFTKACDHHAARAATASRSEQ